MYIIVTDVRNCSWLFLMFIKITNNQYLALTITMTIAKNNWKELLVIDNDY